MIWSCLRRGSRVVSRLANYNPSRFLAFAFLSVGYFVPGPNTTFIEMNEGLTQEIGRELFGYMAWFGQNGSAAVIEEKVCLFRSTPEYRPFLTND